MPQETEIKPETGSTPAEEVKNEEAAEKAAEEKTDLAAELAAEEKEPSNDVDPDPAEDIDPSVIKFQEKFGDKTPLEVFIDLENRVKALENKVF